MSPWFLLGVAMAAEIPAGEGIDRAIGIQVGQEGLDAVADLVPALLPADALAIDDTADTIGIPAICVGGSYELSNIQADIQFNQVQITPLPNELELYLDLTVSLNDPTDPFNMLLDAICLIDENCSGWIDPFHLWVTVPLSFEVLGTPGSRILDAVVGPLQIDHDLTNAQLQTDCLLNDIEEVMNLFGLSIFDLVVGLFGGAIEGAIEPALDEALAAISLSDQVDLLDATLFFAIEPSAAIHSSTGLELHLASQFDADPAPCVRDDDPGSSTATLSPVPPPADNPAGTQVAVHLGADMANQALYAAWRGGALCLAVGGADSGLDLGGLALDTSLLGLIGGEGFDALFPEPRPIEIALRPHAPPVAVMDGPNDVDLSLRELELVFLGELDGRMARAIGVELSADLGANIPFDPATGELAVELVIDPDAMGATLAGDELVEGIARKVEEDFPAVMATLLDGLLPGLLGDALGFVLPTFEGIGLVSLEAEASGAGDWLGAYAAVGQASYADPYAAGCGCGGTGSTTTGGCGCDGGSSTGTGGGCSTAGGAVLPSAWLLVLLGARRRRQ